MIQFGWNRCLQGRHTIVSSFVKSLSQTAHSGEDSTNKPTEYMLRYEPSSRAVGWRWTILRIKSPEVGGGPY